MKTQTNMPLTDLHKQWNLLKYRLCNVFIFISIQSLSNENLFRRVWFYSILADTMKSGEDDTSWKAAGRWQVKMIDHSWIVYLSSFYLVKTNSCMPLPLLLISNPCSKLCYASSAVTRPAPSRALIQVEITRGALHLVEQSSREDRNVVFMGL